MLQLECVRMHCYRHPTGQHNQAKSQSDLLVKGVFFSNTFCRPSILSQLDIFPVHIAKFFSISDFFIGPVFPMFSREIFHDGFRRSCMLGQKKKQKPGLTAAVGVSLVLVI